MDENDVRRIVHDVMDETIKWKSCPVCKDTVHMVSVSWDEDTEEESFRCLGCLGLFGEVLLEKHPPTVTYTYTDNIG